MVLLHQAVRVLLVLYLSAENFVKAFPGGAPASACVSLTPFHGPNVTAQTTPPPYGVDTTPFNITGLGRLYYIPNTTYQLTFQSLSEDPFRGFLLQARLAIDSTTTVGSFQVIDTSLSRLSDCSPSEVSVTHTNNVEKLSITMLWRSPPAGTGPIRIRFAVCRSLLTFWADQQSPEILELGGPTVCPDLEEPDNGDVIIVVDPPGSPAMPGNIAVYLCEPGFFATTPGQSSNSRTALRFCQSDGTWSSLVPTCEPEVFDCGPLDNPENGQVIINGNIAQYTCNAGYELVGASSRVCMSNGSYSGMEPICQEVIFDCPSLANPVNGQVFIRGNFAVYICDEGFDLVGESTRVCMLNGTYSGVEPICQSVNCEILLDPDNGVVNHPDEPMQGDIAQYTCNFGFQLNGVPQRECLDSGLWSEDAPTCEPTDCGLLDSPANGVLVHFDSTFPGSAAHYLCSEGFFLVGPAVRFCEINGEWSGNDSFCQAIPDCGPLDDPEYGTVCHPMTQQGSLAEYFCNPGFVLVGSCNRTCLESGLWSDEAPICEAIFDCGPLPEPDNGRVFVINSLLGGRVDYFCNPGFNLSGNSTRFCTQDGWTEMAPVCEPIPDCGILPNPENGNVVHFSTRVGGIARYSCNPGFALVGPPARECQQNASWSLSPPICKEFEVSLIVNESEANVLEGDIGQNVAVSGYFSAQIDSPLERDAIFDFFISPSSTAAEFVDYFVAGGDFFNGESLVIPSGFSGSFSTHIDVIIIGDVEVETVEIIVFDLIARSECDQVVFPEDSSSLQITIFDNDGNCLPFGPLAGDQLLPRTDDGSSPPQIKFNISCPFYGQPEDTLFVNANGVLSFRTSFSSFTPVPFPLFGNILIAPFWDDVFILNNGNIFYRLSYDGALLQQVGAFIIKYFGVNFTPAVVFIATWDRVPEIGQPADIVNSFQAAIATDGIQLYVIFNYKDIQWGRRRSTSGFNAGDNVRFFNLATPSEETFPGTSESGDGSGDGNTLILESSSNVGLPGTFIYRMDQQDIIFPPTVNCGPLPNPANGAVSHPSTVEGSIATYSCNSGFALMGQDTRMCQSNGEWSGQEPTCDGVADCGPLLPPENGAVLHPSTDEGSNATYSCDSGFTLLGEDTRICQESGVWSGSEPQCSRLSFSYVQNTPTVVGRDISFMLSFDAGIIGARCELVYANGDPVAQATEDCSSGSVEFTNLPGRPIQSIIPRVVLTADDGLGEFVVQDPMRRLILGFRSRCSVHLINGGVTITGSTVVVEWGLSAPADVDTSTISVVCRLNQDTVPCMQMRYESATLLSGDYQLRIRPSQGCRTNIPLDVQFTI